MKDLKSAVGRKDKKEKNGKKRKQKLFGPTCTCGVCERMITQVLIAAEARLCRAHEDGMGRTWSEAVRGWKEEEKRGTEPSECRGR